MTSSYHSLSKVVLMDYMLLIFGDLMWISFKYVYSAQAICLISENIDGDENLQAMISW